MKHFAPLRKIFHSHKKSNQSTTSTTEPKMAPVIFLTGITGYLGGHTAVFLTEQHPDWTINALVRTDSQAAAIKAAFPAVNTVIGDLDNAPLLTAQAALADLVLNLASSDHLPSARALLAGLAQRDPATHPLRHLLHVSGTGVLADFSTGQGNLAPRVWSDIKDIREITTAIPLTAPHRDVDAAVIDGGLAMGVPTAILCPPTIHGVGRGPLKKRSIQVNAYVAGALSLGKAFKLGEGTNAWGQLHVDDAARAFVFLAERALSGESEPGGSGAQWGAEGYYFPEMGEFSWLQVAEATASYLRREGVIAGEEVETISAEEAARLHPWGPLIWGANCRAVGDRLRGLGWRAMGPTLLEDLPNTIEFERGLAAGKSA